LTSNGDMKPEILLESLHKKMWEKYRDKRIDWKPKSLRVLVGWDENKQGETIIEEGDCPESQWDL